MAFEQGIRRNEREYERLRRLLAREVFAPDVEYGCINVQAVRSNAAEVTEPIAVERPAPVWRTLPGEVGREQATLEMGAGDVANVMEVERRTDDDRRARNREWTIEQWLELVEQEQRRHSRPFE